MILSKHLAALPTVNGPDVSSLVYFLNGKETDVLTRDHLQAAAYFNALVGLFKVRIRLPRCVLGQNSYRRRNV